MPPNCMHLCTNVNACMDVSIHVCTCNHCSTVASTQGICPSVYYYTGIITLGHNFHVLCRFARIYLLYSWGLGMTYPLLALGSWELFSLVVPLKWGQLWYEKIDLLYGCWLVQRHQQCSNISCLAVLPICSGTSDLLRDSIP